MKIGFGGIIGAFLGFILTKRFFGAIIGYFIGSAFDNFKNISSNANKNSGRTYSYDPGYYTQRISQNDFASALLVLSGAVMKADGKILKAELDFVKVFFKKQFSENLAKQYILKFKDILEKDFNLQQVCSTISSVMPSQQRSLLVQYLFGIAQADGHVSTKEVDLIRLIAGYLKLSRIEFEQLKSMFYKDASNAYKVLGVTDNATDIEIKKAYRKMAVQHHPDKFSQLGEEQQTAAKEKFQKIQDAYETIKKERGFK